jgi:hypothetical protein
VDLGPAVRGRMLGRRLVVVDVYLSPASLGSLHGLLTLCHCRVSWSVLEYFLEVQHGYLFCVLLWYLS